MQESEYRPVSKREPVLEALKTFRAQLELQRSNGVTDAVRLESAISELNDISMWLQADCLPDDIPPFRKAPPARPAKRKKPTRKPARRKPPTRKKPASRKKK